MKKTTLTLLIIGSALFIIRCSSSKKTTATTNEITHEKILVEAQKTASSLTLANITNGADIYDTKCMKCHGTKGGIKNYSKTEWVTIINSMAKKARLTQDEKSNLSYYILSKRELIGTN